MSSKLQVLNEDTCAMAAAETTLERAASVAVADMFLSDTEKQQVMEHLKELSDLELRLSKQFSFSVPTTDKKEVSLWAAIYNGMVFSLPTEKKQVLVSAWLYN